MNILKFLIVAPFLILLSTASSFAFATTPVKENVLYEGYDMARVNETVLDLSAQNFEVTSNIYIQFKIDDMSISEQGKLRKALSEERISAEQSHNTEPWHGGGLAESLVDATIAALSSLAGNAGCYVS